VCTLRAEQIKNTKTILRAYISDIDEAFIEDLAPQKITAKIIKHEIFCGTGFYKRRQKVHISVKKCITFSEKINQSRPYFPPFLFFLRSFGPGSRDSLLSK
jgi:hypothetical protein